MQQGTWGYARNKGLDDYQTIQEILTTLVETIRCVFSHKVGCTCACNRHSTLSCGYTSHSSLYDALIIAWTRCAEELFSYAYKTYTIYLSAQYTIANPTFVQIWSGTLFKYISL